MDLVLLDIVMFGLDGLEVVCYLVSFEFWLVVVFCIVYDVYVLLVFEVVVIDYLMKLVCVEWLVVVIVCVCMFLVGCDG